MKVEIVNCARCRMIRLVVRDEAHRQTVEDCPEPYTVTLPWDTPMPTRGRWCSISSGATRQSSTTR